MNLLKKVEGVPLLNFEGGPGVPLLNFRGVPGPEVLFPLLHHVSTICTHLFIRFFDSNWSSGPVVLI